MKRLILILSVFALFAASCGGSTVEPGDDPETTSTSGESADTSSDAASSTDVSTSDTSTSATETKPRPDGPAAPDFTIALAPTGEFVLSQEVKPVYMVFWAEW